MPNTARGGGISRKITDAADRKRLKEIAQELEVPEGMGVIVRTAGAARTKPEIKRDFEYLMRMWENGARTDPALDRPGAGLRGRLADQARHPRPLQQGHRRGHGRRRRTAIREAQDFMRLLMPSHVKNVQPYRDPQPIFAKWGAESQLDALFHNQVTLKSGGYLVINQTEALVAIDVNSGRSTREHNIEDTALRTNLEAADEVARQLRLRDLAGLIVIDFIDMEESRNNRAVERRLKEALKDDRARIQVGRISHFGLLEMSRQRIRTGVLEGSSVICPHCGGAGTVRSTASVAVHVMRVLEDALIKSAAHNIILRTRTDIALYILNQKRSLLRLIEERFGVSVTVEADDSLTGGAYHALERGEPAAGPSDPARRFDPRRPIEDIEPIGDAELDAELEEEAGVEAAEARIRKTATSAATPKAAAAAAAVAAGAGVSIANSAGVDANAPQPSDEGLETVAEIAGEFMAARRRGRRRRQRRARGKASRARRLETAQSQPFGRRNRRIRGRLAQERRSGRGAGRDGRRRRRLDRNPGRDAGFRAAAVLERRSRAGAAGSGPRRASRNAGGKRFRPGAGCRRNTPKRSRKRRPKTGAGAPAQPELPVITEADPDAPKRTGWWARAKANLTGR